MEPLDSFAQAPQRGEGHYFKNNVLAPEVKKILEEMSILRPYFTPKSMDGALSKSFRLEKEEGIAVQIAGNSEVPREEDVRKLFHIVLHRNATGYKIDDDDKRINRNEPGYEKKKMEAAMRRMHRKENKDLMDVMFAGAQTITQIPATGTFDVETIADTTAKMIDNARKGPNKLVLQPDVILMPYQMFVELQKDPKFQFVPEIYQEILLNAKVVPGGNRGIMNGETGQIVAGLRIVIVNDLDNTAIIMDTAQDSLWLCEDEAPRISKYRDEEHISDIVDIRHDQQAVCVLPECLAAIKKADSTSGTTDPTTP